MVRQAHTYLAGAVSGTALIGAAVVAFVLLVSLQALRDWPLAGIGRGGDSSAVSSGHPAASGGAGATAIAGAGATTARSAAGGNNAGQRGDRAGESRQEVGAATPGTPPAPTADSSPVSEAPAPSPPTSGGGAPNPSAPPASSSSGGGGNAGGGGGGGQVSLPGTGGAGGSGTGQSTSGAVTGAVNNTVSGVDQTLGGPLGNAGVTKVTEEVVSGAAGPESPVGETVDKVVETVGGLLGGKR